MSQASRIGQSKESVESVQSFWEGHVNNEYYTGEARASAAYFDEIRERRYRWHYHLRELFDQLTGSEGDLLEIGCGIGVDSIELARCGFRVTGIDLTQAAIDIATQHATHRKADIAFQTGNAEAVNGGVKTIHVAAQKSTTSGHLERAMETG